MDKQGALYFWLDLVATLAMVVALAMFIRFFIISPFHVFGPSMCNTLNELDGECVNDYGELIIVNELLYQKVLGASIGEPQTGDVVVFTPPGGDGSYYIKRIIGTPGDTLKIENGSAFMKVDGKFIELDESAYLSESNLNNTPSNNPGVEYTVPEDSYFVMGDNRNRSTDSRSCFSQNSDGPCDGSNENAYITRGSIRGKASIVFWPPVSLRLIDDLH